MPEGIPRTDEQRREKHKEEYGDEEIPTERRGLASKPLALSKRVVYWIEGVLILVLAYILFFLLQKGGVI